jgi:phosphinothricin acetyltransferase
MSVSNVSIGVSVDVSIDISIREMSAEDWPRVVEIYRQGLRTGISTLESQAPEFEAWDAAHDKRCRLVAVADGTIANGGEIAGWVALSPVSGRCVYAGVAELSVYVAEEYRGRNVGRVLLNALIEESEKAGFWTLQAGIQEENAASLALHHRCGFRTVGIRERLGRDPRGRWCSIMLLERRSGVVGADR